jgi:hypothetical protein
VKNHNHNNSFRDTFQAAGTVGNFQDYRFWEVRQSEELCLQISGPGEFALFRGEGNEK